MTKISTTVSAIALLAAVTGLAADGASAQRRNRDAAPAATPAPSVNRAVATAYQTTNTAITAMDWAAADAALVALRAAAVSPYEKFIAAQADFRIALGQHSDARQATAIDAMIDSGGIPADAQAQIYVAGAQTAFNAHNFAVAATRSKRAIELGSTVPNLDNMLLSSYFQGNQLDQGLAEARSMITAAEARGTHAPEAIYSLTAVALQGADRKADLLDILVQRAGAYPSELNFRSAALIYLDSLPDDRGRTIDALRLVRAAGAMNERRYYIEYVTDLAEDAQPGEAIEGIAAGRAANLIQTPDRTFDEIAATAQTNLAEDRRTLAGSAATARTRPDARLATRVGDAYLSAGDYPHAEENYQLALTKTTPDAGLINTRLGIARYRAGNYPGALEAFAAVQDNRAPLARLWAAFVHTKMTPAAAPAAAPATPAPPAPPAAH